MIYIIKCKCVSVRTVDTLEPNLLHIRNQNDQKWCHQLLILPKNDQWLNQLRKNVPFLCLTNAFLWQNFMHFMQQSLVFISGINCDQFGNRNERVNHETYLVGQEDQQVGYGMNGCHHEKRSRVEFVIYFARSFELLVIYRNSSEKSIEFQSFRNPFIYFIVNLYFQFRPKISKVEPHYHQLIPQTLQSKLNEIILRNF